MQLSDAVKELLLATQANGRSEQTVADYDRKLRSLVEFLGDPDITAITPRDLRRYLTDLRGRTCRYDAHPNRRPVDGGLSTATLAAYGRALRRLFHFAETEGYVVENPARKVHVPKPGRGEPKGISVEDFAQLLRAIDSDSTIDRRNRALLLLLADSAARVGGIVRLKVSDVDVGLRQVHLREKGNKERPAFFSPVTGQAIKAWLEVRPLNQTQQLFLNLGNRGGDVLTEQGVREVLRRLKRKAGVKGPVNPHSFRHGFAREFLKNGGDLASLADIMGHSDVRVTWQAYAIFTMEELKAAHARYSPVVRLEREGILSAT